MAPSFITTSIPFPILLPTRLKFLALIRTCGWSITLSRNRRGPNALRRAEGSEVKHEKIESQWVCSRTHAQTKAFALRKTQVQPPQSALDMDAVWKEGEQVCKTVRSSCIRKETRTRLVDPCKSR